MYSHRDAEKDLLRQHLGETGRLPPANVNSQVSPNTPFLQENPELESSVMMMVAKEVDRLYDAAGISEGGNLAEALRTLDWGMIRDCLDYASVQIDSVSLPEQELRDEYDFTDEDMEGLARVLPLLTSIEVEVMTNIEKKLQERN